MKTPRMSLDEFKMLAAGKFASQEELQSEYESFLKTIEALAEVPALSATEKADIFRHSWQARPQKRAGLWFWLGLLRQPAVTFAFGLVLGCLAMFAWMRPQPATAEPVAPEPPLTVERTRHTQTYAGKAVQALYPEIENPKIVVEQAEDSGAPQRVLYGTLDDGEIYVVWNL